MAFPDYVEFIASLNDQGVRYLVVGAHAVAYHARPRATKDLDIFIDRVGSKNSNDVAEVQKPSRGMSSARACNAKAFLLAGRFKGTFGLQPHSSWRRKAT